MAGAFDQLNEALLLQNPLFLLSVVVETAVVAAFEGAGFDPGPRHVSHHYRDMLRPPPSPYVDTMSADYTKGYVKGQGGGSGGVNPLRRPR